MSKYLAVITAQAGFCIEPVDTVVDAAQQMAVALEDMIPNVDIQVHITDSHFGYWIVECEGHDFSMCMGVVMEVSAVKESIQRGAISGIQPTATTNLH